MFLRPVSFYLSLIGGVDGVKPGGTFVDCAIAFERPLIFSGEFGYRPDKLLGAANLKSAAPGRVSVGVAAVKNYVGHQLVSFLSLTTPLT
jgi:hypothetical protein